MLTPEQEREFRDRVSGSRLRLRARSAFFATLLLHADVTPSRRVKLAATDGVRVYLHPEEWGGLDKGERDAALLHAVLHAALSHVPRRLHRDKQRWNRAADIIVNGLVESAGLPLPPAAPRDAHLERLSAEEAYAAIPAQEDDGDGDLLDGPPEDAPSHPGEGEAPGRESGAARHWKRALEQARTVSRMSGEGEGPGFSELKADTPRLDWRSQLWRFLARTPVDFGGFDRRFLHAGLYLEALDELELRVLVGVDTSGSIAEAAVQGFLGEVQGILQAYPQLKATLYHFDTRAYGPHPLRAGDPLPAVQGGGGTDFRPLFAVPELADADAVVVLTDGYGDFPGDPGVDTLWAVLPGGLESPAFPFGEVARMEGSS